MIENGNTLVFKILRIILVLVNESLFTCITNIAILTLNTISINSHAVEASQILIPEPGLTRSASIEELLISEFIVFVNSKDKVFGTLSNAFFSNVVLVECSE